MQSAFLSILFSALFRALNFPTLCSYIFILPDNQHQFGSAEALSVTDTNSCAPPMKDGDPVYVKEEQPIGKEDEVDIILSEL